MKILIVKLSAIGDVIHTLPALTALRRQYPAAHITWVAEEAAADLLRGHGALNRLLVSRRKRWLRQIQGPGRRAALGEMADFVRHLRDTRYDLVLDFQALLKSAAIVLLARGGRKLGFDRGMEHMEHSWLALNERIPPVSMEIHALERNLMMLEPLGIHTREALYDIPADRETRRMASDLAAACGREGRPLVAVNPMAGWESKLWPEGRFARLVDRLVHQWGARVCLTGSGADRPALSRIAAATRSRPTNLAGKTGLRVLAAFYRRCDLVITTDTGPMHLAAAVDTPVVALFGPTAPNRTGPYGRRHRVVQAPLPCRPCFKRRCEISEDCMQAITVQQVLAAAATVLAADTHRGGRCHGG